MSQQVENEEQFNNLNNSSVQMTKQWMSLGFQELRCLKKITVNQTDETLHGAKKENIINSYFKSSQYLMLFLIAFWGIP